MRYKQLLILTAILSFLFLETNLWSKAYIDINSPALRKFPIAISKFKNIENSKDQEKLDKILIGTLSSDLEYSGFFTLIDPKYFPQSFSEDGITGQEINFRKWASTGAELLIKGGLTQKGDSITIETRLFDTAQGRFITGKRYSGKIDDLRKMAHKFANEILLKLSGTEGVFETKIAFVSNAGGNKEIYVMDYDGYNIMKLTSNKSINLMPAWSPDAKKLIYASFKSRYPKLYLLDLFFYKESILLNRKGLTLGGSWCKTNNKIALSLSTDGNSDLYSMNPDGSELKRLTDNFAIDVSPSWSPDGRWLAFTSSRSGTPQIYIMDSDGGNLRRLSFEGNYNASPSWSPKGDKITFASQQNGVFDIFVINTDGSELKRLTDNSGSNESPSWSPDGRFIAFSSSRNERSRIYIMNADGSNQKLVGSTKGNETNPSWSPDFGDFKS